VKECTIQAGLQQQVSSLRGLRFTQAVPCREYKTFQIRRFLRESLASANEGRLLEYEEALLKSLRLLPVGFDYAEQLVQLYAEHAAGFYSPHRKQYITVAKLYPKQREFTQVHELTHALQDQHYDLLSFLSDKLTIDEHYGRLAVAEGDATALLNRFNKTLDCDATLKKTGLERMESRRILVDGTPVPLYLQLSFDYPYAFGLRYYCWAERGERDLFLEPPKTSAQVMTLEQTVYELNSPPLNALIPEELLLSLGEPQQTNRLGQFVFFSLLAHHLSLEAALEISNSLKGDKAWLFDVSTKPEQVLPYVVWWLRFDSTETTQLVAELLEKHFDGATAIDDERSAAHFASIERSTTGVLVTVRILPKHHRESVG